MQIAKFIIFVSLFLALKNVGNAQTPRAFEHAANKAFEAKDYYSALKYYEKVLEMTPDRADVQHRHADAARLFGAYAVAEASYQRVMATDSAGLYRPAVFWLATIEKTLGRYELAIKYFEQYKNYANADPVLLQKAITELEECEWAMERTNAPDAGIVIERLPEEPNTAYSEFGATQRGDTMFYSSFRPIDWKDKHDPARPIIKIMEAIEGRAPAQSLLNDPKRHTAHTAFSPAGDLMIFNNCDYVGETDVRCELMFSKKIGTDWSKGVRLPDFINVPGFTATQPNIAAEADGTFTLYFVSDCEGGKGGLDIWKAKFSADGNFSKPENLADLNTPEDDITPFFDHKGKALYFSTLGYKSLGGFDIYKSRVDSSDATKWLAPTHLDIPFNSSFNDVYFAPQGDDWAYFSSNRAGSAYISEEACCYDIYRGTFLKLRLQTLAFSKLSGEPLNEVIFTLMEKPQVAPVISRFSSEQNQTEFDVKRDNQYIVIASKEGYKPDTVFLATNTLPPTRKFVEKLYLAPDDFALNVRTFNQVYKSPLKGVSIRLMENLGDVKEEKNTSESNEADLKVKAETQYTIVGSKSGYLPDTVQVGATELKPGAKVTKNLFLTPGSLGNFLPLSLFFDNDQPDANTRREFTALTYEQSFDKYYARREEFIREFTKGMSPADKQQAETKLNAFFEEEVRAGFMKLDYFAENLNLFLENGYKVEIMIKGFASPLANPDYNMALTKRRISSVMNFFRKAEGGIFNPYLINGQLAVVTVPFGETASAKNVSDDYRNKRLSIFSVEASRERRAEILEIRLTRKLKD